MTLKDFELIKDTVNFPVWYDSNGTHILDADNNKVLDIRGWGRIQKMSEPEHRQDLIGSFVAGLMNQAIKNSNSL